VSKSVRKLKLLQRIPVIIDGVKNGLPYTKIAKTCGVSERTIRRDRESIPFRDFFNSLVDDYLGKLSQMEGGDDKQRGMALKHKGMLVRAMLKGVIPTKIDAKVETTGEMQVIYQLRRPEPEEEEPDE